MKLLELKEILAWPIYRKNLIYKTDQTFSWMGNWSSNQAAISMTKTIFDICSEIQCDHICAKFLHLGKMFKVFGNFSVLI